jgi:hypothetical protein
VYFESFLILFFDFGFDFAGIDNKLVFHDNGHVRDFKFRLIGGDETQFDEVVLLNELLFFDLSF